MNTITYTVDQIRAIEERIDCLYYERTWFGVFFCQDYKSVFRSCDDGSFLFLLENNGNVDSIKYEYTENFEYVFTYKYHDNPPISSREFEYFPALVGSAIESDGKIVLNRLAGLFKIEIDKEINQELFM